LIHPNVNFMGRAQSTALTLAERVAASTIVGSDGAVSMGGRLQRAEHSQSIGSSHAGSKGCRWPPAHAADYRCRKRTKELRGSIWNERWRPQGFDHVSDKRGRCAATDGLRDGPGKTIT
jgi:hypothetical protein